MMYELKNSCPPSVQGEGGPGSVVKTVLFAVMLNLHAQQEETVEL